MTFKEETNHLRVSSLMNRVLVMSVSSRFAILGKIQYQSTYLQRQRTAFAKRVKY